jgi:hypothetical protein
MGHLADHVTISKLAARSVNLERDDERSEFTGYVPTARAMDTLRRVFEGLSTPVGTRAWSVTGPYGSGKSSFALLLDALCGPSSSRRDSAVELLAPVAPDVTKVSTELVDATNGLVRATTVATIEPVTTTIARALSRGAARRWPARMPRHVHHAVTAVADHADIADIKELIHILGGYAPVLIIVDEFGKNLEYHVDVDQRDLFILQELAEMFSGADSGLAGGVITLQHLAFEDYASTLTTASRREWAKVQGRFEDISFVDAPDQVVRLIADTIQQQPATSAMARRIESWATDATRNAEALGLFEHLGESRSIVRSCFPIHPVAAAALPELCGQYGQYERTLVSFLASGEQDSVLAFCTTTPDDDPLGTVGLVEVYDYFVTSARTLTGAAAGATRWLEIESRINDAHVDDDDLALLKIIGVLNLVSGNGPLRASAAMVTFAADVTNAGADEIKRRLGRLAERGLVAHRSFADEYRLWSGSDFDVSGTIAGAREMLSNASPAELVRDATSPVPIIAGRHTQHKGILRYFDVVYAGADSHVDLPPTFADGTVVYVVSRDGNLPTVSDQTRPVVFVRSEHTDEPLAAAIELAAISQVLRDHSAHLSSDWVARRELQERSAQARAEVTAKLTSAFDPSRDGVTWACDNERLVSTRGASGALSCVCDRVFADSPTVRNEMVARRELTSQGAKARRLLMEGMLLREDVDRLGFDGYGPERAMYHAVLDEPGFHRPRTDGMLRFGPPHRTSDWLPAWKTLQGLFAEAEVVALSIEDVCARLTSRPIGIKAGVIPILLTVGLLHRRDDIAIYEDGTYQPKLSADLLERLVRNPDRFAIKNFAASTGDRGKVIALLANELKVDITPLDRRRNTTVLALMAPLLGTVRRLPDYTLKTTEMSDKAVAVRDALLAAREPDEVLFRDLPVALDLAPIPARRSDGRGVGSYATLLASAVRELQRNWADLLGRIEEQLRASMATPTRSQLRGDLSARASHLSDQVLDPRLRAFLLTASDSSLRDSDWVEAVAMTAIDKPVRTWRDQDWPAFVAAAVQLGGTLKRLEALNYEHIARGSTEFTARRITITNPDGTETSTVVVTDPQLDQAVEEIVARLIDDATAALPEAALPALVARLTEELHPTRSAVVVMPNDLEAGRRHA